MEYLKTDPFKEPTIYNPLNHNTHDLIVRQKKKKISLRIPILIDHIRRSGLFRGL